MTVSRSARFVLTAAALTVAAALGGCGSSEPSYSSLDDAAIMKLLPTETEVKTVLTDVKSVPAPKAQVPNPDFEPAKNESLSPECYEAYNGTKESRRDVPVRMFVMQSNGSGESIYTWVVSQRPLPENVKKSRKSYEDRIRKCDNFETFDAGTSNTGIAYKPTGNEDAAEGAGGFIAHGDVSVAFNVSGVPIEKAKDLVKKMAPIMEKRLKASAPEA